MSGEIERTGPPESLEDFLDHEVVLDTAGPIFYLGRLLKITESGYWLEQADLHDVREGHAPREQYIAESRRDGIRVNRRMVFVLKQTVISISALNDVIDD